MVVLLSACSSGQTVTSSSSRLSSPTPAVSPPISAEWTEYHRDAGRSGVGPSDPALGTPALAWRADFDGDVYASPLIVNGHVIVATENNTVYSLDLFTGSVVWKTHLGDPVSASSLPCGDIGPVTGITGTPAADEASGRLFVAAFLSGAHHMLFAMSLADGSITWQRPVDPVGSVPSVEQQRGALSVASGLVYVPLGGLYGDCGAYHGYMVGISLDGATALAYEVPSGRGAGLWSPQGATIAPDGTVYIVTGNATAGGNEYSNAVIGLSPDLHTVRSRFTPPNWAELNASDTDLGSVGAALLPSGLVVAVGKEGVAYALRNGAQVASLHACGGAWGGTAWSGSTVFVPCVDGLYALNVGDSSISIAWRASHPQVASPIVSAGAVWAIEPQSGTLFALDPSNGSVRYSTGLGSAKHFSTPAATDGFIVAPAGRSVVALAVVS